MSATNVSSVESGKTTSLTFSSDIHRISQISDSNERQYYVLNLFDKMDDVDMDLEDFDVIMTNVDAHADSLVDSPESQAYLSQITVADDVKLSQEVAEPITYA
jgi:hypothetical protein